MKEITIQIKDVYGQEKYYPMCEDSKVFARMVGTSQLTPNTIQLIKKLGYEVKVQQRQPAI
jgi:hypothetical protein